MIKICQIISLAIIITFITGCGMDNTDGNTVAPIGSSQYISATTIEDINSSTMLAILKNSGDTTTVFAFGYKAIKITYNTVGQNGEAIVASGLLTIPSASAEYNAYRVSQNQSPFSVSMLCDNHGTIFTNAEAPTNVETSNGLPEHSLAVSITAKAGFAAILPDYIGYGDSNESYKPYMLKNASAQDSLDMIKASIKYMNDNNIPINYQLFISGYSQGGYTALALAQKIENSFSDKISLMAVAPMAAPSMLKIFADNVLKSDANMGVPAFMAFLANSYAFSYSNLTIDEMIINSKIDTFDGLFDGTNNINEIHTQLQLPLGAPTIDLFNSDFVNDYETTPNHKLKELFAANDVVSWNSSTKINLLHCKNDDVIPYTMSLGAKQSLDAYGSSNVITTIIEGVTYINGNSIHASCALDPAIGTYVQALGWFDKIRQGKIK